jgi:hypothetical protein
MFIHTVQSHRYVYMRLSLAQGCWRTLFGAIKKRAYGLYKRRVPLKNIKLSYIDKAGDQVFITSGSALEIAHTDSVPDLLTMVALHDCSCITYNVVLAYSRKVYCEMCREDQHELVHYRVNLEKFESSGKTKSQDIQSIHLCADCLPADAPWPGHSSCVLT